MERKYTKEELLHILNYDTYACKVLSLTERCEVHNVINGRKILNSSLNRTLNNILLKIKVNHYTKVWAEWKENEQTTEKELIIKSY